MKYLYYVIFGEEWGSGHLTRAIEFKKNKGNDDVEILIEFEKTIDQKVVSKYLDYKKPRLNNSHEYILINDTLGIFDLDGEYKDVWYLDDISEFEHNKNSKKYHILYPSHSSSLFPFINDVMPKKLTSVMIVQGGGDDHHQIPCILKEVPSNYYKFVCIGVNCRYIEELKIIINDYENVTLLINVPILQLLPSVDYVVTAGGNTLIEILSNRIHQKVIVYTKEKKEMQTANFFKDKDGIIKIFPINEFFKWDIQ